MTKSARGFLLDNMFSMAAYWASTGTVVAALMAYYQVPVSVSNFVVGFSSTLPVAQLLGGLLYARCRQRGLFVRFFCAGWRVLLPVLFFSVLLPHGAGAVVAIVSYCGALLLYQLSCPAQNDWMVNTLKEQIKSDYYALRETGFMLLLTLSFCALSMLIDRGQKHDWLRPAFLWGGVYIGLALLLSLIVLFRLPPPAEGCRTARKHLIGTVLRDRSFRPVLLGGILWGFSTMFVGGFASTYIVQVLGMPFQHIMIWTTASNLLRSLCTPVMARLSDRLGWARTVALCMGIYLVSGAAWFATTAENMLVLYPLSSLLGGLSYAGIGVGMFNLQLGSMPASDQSSYFSTYSAATGLAALAGSSLCSVGITLLSGAALPLTWLFTVGIGGGLLTALIVRRVRPRPAAADA